MWSVVGWESYVLDSYHRERVVAGDVTLGAPSDCDLVDDLCNHLVHVPL